MIGEPRLARPFKVLQEAGTFRCCLTTVMKKILTMISPERSNRQVQMIISRAWNLIFKDCLQIKFIRKTYNRRTQTDLAP